MYPVPLSCCREGNSGTQLMRRGARVKARNIFNLGVGADNPLHSEGRVKYTASLNIDNLTNKAALYNFLSTFSGKHFLQPRMILVKIGLTF
jgi:hypothetical protein